MSTHEESHVITYSPSAVRSNNITVSILKLKSLGVKFIRVQWVDLINFIRYRVIPIDHFAKMLETSRPGVSVTTVTLGLVFATAAPGFSAIGEYLYAVDMNSLRLCPYAPGHASVMGWFQEKVPTLGPNKQPMLETPLCPRTTLKRIVGEAKAAGIEFLVGFETEFILLRSTNPIRAVNEYGWSNSAALLSGTDESKVLEEIADALHEAGIELQMYHAESAPGQYEVVTGPLQPLEAADALVHTRETIYNIASKYGLRATLAPRVYMDNCGSAAHTHISVHSTSPPTPSNTSNLNSNEASFLSSLLAHLPAITAINLPIRASYKRMMDGVWSGGTYVCWGTDNREAPVRLCNATSPTSRNFEIKALDGTANPYLALAGILGAGFVGIREKQALEVKDCGGELTAAQMTEDGRRELGIKDRLPLSLEEARRRLSADSVVRDILGSTLVDKFLSVNETLGRLLEGTNETASLTRLVENY